MTEPQLLSVLRRSGWRGIPSSPGVYWWYFPLTALERLRIAELCDVAQLRLRRAPDGNVCLYHGMANNLVEPVEWHAAQKLTLNCLQSGYLSTFRFTLLALNEFNYLEGTQHIDGFSDDLSVSCQAASTRGKAEALERAELRGAYHYPLNIQGNRRAELFKYVRHLKSARSAYKRLYV
jgi:GIY-YIG catalytic domain